MIDPEVYGSADTVAAGTALMQATPEQLGEAAHRVAKISEYLAAIDTVDPLVAFRKLIVAAEDACAALAYGSPSQRLVDRAYLQVAIKDALEAEHVMLNDRARTIDKGHTHI